MKRKVERERERERGGGGGVGEGGRRALGGHGWSKLQES